MKRIGRLLKIGKLSISSSRLMHKAYSDLSANDKHDIKLMIRAGHHKLGSLHLTVYSVETIHRGILSAINNPSLLAKLPRQP